MCCGNIVFAQTTLPSGTGTNTSATNKKDTSKTNTNKWKDEDARITYEKLGSSKTYFLDSELHTFQREPFLGEWGRDLGNLGSPINNLFFTPETRIGPSLGYHVYDPYRYNTDSLPYINTNRPYSIFAYELGSKLEQTASLMHTQNVKPNWNFTFQYRKINSPGFYQVQRNNHDNAYVSTNYKSLDKHYTLYASMVYNHIQNDENGGLINPLELQDAQYSDRKTVDVAYVNDGYSTTRSPVYNNLRDFTVLLQHSYTWGKSDTTYNSDSTQFSYKLVPRFSITHKMELSTEKHTFKDLSPDSVRYATLFSQSFTNNGSGYYTTGEDSVFVQQNWFWVDNKLLLNGFLGPEAHPTEFSAGVGNRYDEFTFQPVRNLVDTIRTLGINRDKLIHNYLEGQIKKEALQPGQWEYGVTAKLFVTGEDAGNFLFNAAIGKDLKDGWASFVAGFRSDLNTAPASYTNYSNADTQLLYSFKPESVNMQYISLSSSKLRFSAGVNNYIIGDYIYINAAEVPAQYTVPFTITQVWLRKIFKVGHFYLDNELAYQQLPVNAPVNVPAVMGRHQLSYEQAMFKRKLKVEAGIEMRYTTSYNPAGYDALLNRFYYQNTTYVSNPPEFSVFLNFKVKRFRAFVMGDNLQALIFRNNILFAGTPVINYPIAGSVAYPVYASPDALIRFGFSWPLIN